MATLDELIEELDDGDNRATARAILTRSQLPRDIEVLLPAVVEYVLIHRRSQTRSNERVAMAEGGPTNAQARARLTADTFSIGSGKFVTWGQATVEQHEMRISHLISHRNGVDETIGRHTAAIAAIQDAGVFCLDQIDEAAA